MKTHAEFNQNSNFIDIGSGLGKPCLHVAQDPGVKFSFGIEVSEVRWRLSISAFHKILQTTLLQVPEQRINHKCFFALGDIKRAVSFDPLTHVYMYNHGFHPVELSEIANKFNNSFTSQYLICYLNYKKVQEYGFDVEPPICSIKTSMAGSNTCHTAYIYKHKLMPIAVSRTTTATCDPLYRMGYFSVNKGLEYMVDYMKNKAENCNDQCRSKRNIVAKKTTSANRRDQWYARFSALSREPNSTISEVVVTDARDNLDQVIVANARSTLDLVV